jgi:hypothetical protein
VAIRVRNRLGWQLPLKGLFRAFEICLSFYWVLSLVACIREIRKG